MGPAELANETLDGLIAAAEPAGGHQVLPDGHGIAPAAQPQFDGLAIRLAGTGGRTPLGRLESLFFWNRPAKVGGHLVGRFCRRSPSPRTGWSHRDPGRFQVSACGFSTYTGSLLDAPQGPSEASQ